VATGVVAPTKEAATPQELVQAMRRGEISIGIVIPPDHERRRAEGREAVQILVDGSDNAVQSAAAQLEISPRSAWRYVQQLRDNGARVGTERREGKTFHRLDRER